MQFFNKAQKKSSTKRTKCSEFQKVRVSHHHFLKRGFFFVNDGCWALGGGGNLEPCFALSDEPSFIFIRKRNEIV